MIDQVTYEEAPMDGECQVDEAVFDDDPSAEGYVEGGGDYTGEYANETPDAFATAASGELPFYEAAESICAAVMSIKSSLESIEYNCEEGCSAAGASRSIIDTMDEVISKLQEEINLGTAEGRDCDPDAILYPLLAAAKAIAERKSGRRRNHISRKEKKDKKRSSKSLSPLPIDGSQQAVVPPPVAPRKKDPVPLPPGAADAAASAVAAAAPAVKIVPPPSLPFDPVVLSRPQFTTDTSQTDSSADTNDAAADDNGDNGDYHPEVAASSLIEMEDAFVRDLYAFVAFQDAIVGDKVKGVSLSAKQATRLFGNIACVGKCEEELSGALHVALDEEYYPDAIAAAYNSYVRRICVVVRAYAENVVLSNFVLDSLRHNSAWEAAVADLLKNVTSVTKMADVIRLPIDHIQKRREAIAQLRSSLSAEDEAVATLQSTETALEDLEDRIMRYRESSARKLAVLADVERRFSAKETIVRRGRSLCKRGVVAVLAAGPPQVEQKGVMVDQGAKLELPASHLSKSKRKTKVLDAPEGTLAVGGEYGVLLFNDEIIFSPTIPGEVDKKTGKVVFPPLTVAARWPVLSLIVKACPVVVKGTAAFCLHTPSGLFTLEVTAESSERPESVAASWISAISSAFNDRLKTVVFGMPLETLASRPKEISEWSVPLFIQAATEYLEVEGLDEEGIFRLSASASVMNDLIAEIDGGGVPVFVDPHSAANIIKRWLRDSPTSLLQDELIPQWKRALARPDAAAAVRECFFAMRPFNRATAATLFSLLKAVLDNPKNLMSGNNIGIVVGVNLLKDSGVGTQVTEFVLDNYDAVLGESVIDDSCWVEKPEVLNRRLSGILE